MVDVLLMISWVISLFWLVASGIYMAVEYDAWWRHNHRIFGWLGVCCSVVFTVVVVLVSISVFKQEDTDYWQEHRQACADKGGVVVSLHNQRDKAEVCLRNPNNYLGDW